MRTFRRTLPIIALLVLAACGDDEPAGDSTPPDVTLPAPDDAADDPTIDAAGGVDGPWRLVSGTLDGSPVALVDGWDVTLVVEGDRVGGTAACNGYGGTVDLADGGFTVGELSWNEMGCEPAVMELEQAFLGSFGSLTTHAIEGAVLTLSGPGAEWVFERMTPVPDAEIVGTTWALDTYLDGDTASNLPVMELATLTLHDDGTFTGSTSCRPLAGEWLVSGATLRFPSFQAIDDPTAGVCAPESEDLDGIVISVLESGVTVEIDGDRLTLTAAGGEGLSYVAVAEPSDGTNE